MDWQYDRQRRRWAAVIGDWSASVLRTMDQTTWHAVIERRGAQIERYESPEFDWPHEGRAWCEAEIASQQAAAE